MFIKFLFPVIFFSLFIITCRFDRNVKNKPQFFRVECKTQQYRIQNLCDDEKKYLDHASKIDRKLKFQDLNRDYLQNITRDTKDVDIAAAMFYQRLLLDSRNNSFLNFVEKKEKQFNQRLPDYSSRGILFLLVPGMFYKDNKEIEASGNSLRKLVRRVGMKEDLVEIEQTGDVDTNAKIICKYIQNVDQSDIKGIILVSPSKGSGDIKRAIAHCGAKPYFKLVRGWFNIGGITKGSMIVDGISSNFRNYLEARLYFLFKRYNWKGLMSMRNGSNAPLAEKVNIPSFIEVVSVIGIPLFRHVSPRAKPYYTYLIRYGPSDGMVMLADAYIPGGYVYPSFRNDHYFQDPIPENRLLALLSFIVETKF